MWGVCVACVACVCACVWWCVVVVVSGAQVWCVVWWRALFDAGVPIVAGTKYH